MRTAIYARANLNTSPKIQLQTLREYSKARGLMINGEYVDERISAPKAPFPILNEMMNDARNRKIDIVLVWKLDCFAHSMKHLISALREFKDLGIDFISYYENLDTTSSRHKEAFTIIAAIGELEQSLATTRVKEGLDNARKLGKKLGRPGMSFDKEEFKRLIDNGFSINKAGLQMGIPISTAYRTASTFIS